MQPAVYQQRNISINSTAMLRPFLEVLPREIRDQIFTYVLASPSGSVTLSPWTFSTERSLRLLRTCKQIHRECKDIIWFHNGLTIREPTDFLHTIGIELNRRDMLWKRTMFLHDLNISISLELLDRDELEWIISALPAVARWSKLRNQETFQSTTITISSYSERPRCVSEFEEFIDLRDSGSKVDGRLYRDNMLCTGLQITSIWPPFAHWGKHKWLREMLLDSSNINNLVKDMHGIMGGELWVNERLCFKDQAQLLEDMALDPRDGEIKMIIGGC